MGTVTVTADVGTVFENADAVNAAQLADGYELLNEWGAQPIVRQGGEWDDGLGSTLNPDDWDGTFTVTKRGN